MRPSLMLLTVLSGFGCGEKAEPRVCTSVSLRVDGSRMTLEPQGIEVTVPERTYRIAIDNQAFNTGGTIDLASPIPFTASQRSLLLEVGSAGTAVAHIGDWNWEIGEERSLIGSFDAFVFVPDASAPLAPRVEETLVSYFDQGPLGVGFIEGRRVGEATIEPGLKRRSLALDCHGMTASTAGRFRVEVHELVMEGCVLLSVVAFTGYEKGANYTSWIPQMLDSVVRPDES
jgi:hypothetical protein